MPHAGRRRHARRDRAEPRRRVSPVAGGRSRRPDDPVRRPRSDRVSRGGSARPARPGCPPTSSPARTRTRWRRTSHPWRGCRCGRSRERRPGGETGEEARRRTAKAIFAEAGCGGCHTLEAAGASGTVGPNLDDAKPSKELVIDRVTNGKGVMPAFKDSYSAEQIAAVADYVSTERRRVTPARTGHVRGQTPSCPQLATSPSGYAKLHVELTLEESLEARVAAPWPVLGPVAESRGHRIHREVLQAGQVVLARLDESWPCTDPGPEPRAGRGGG